MGPVLQVQERVEKFMEDLGDSHFFQKYQYLRLHNLGPLEGPASPRKMWGVTASYKSFSDSTGAPHTVVQPLLPAKLSSGSSTTV